MKILHTKVLRGPNYWSAYREKLIVIRLDLEESEDYPTDKIDGFAERLEAAMPSLYEHTCSEKKPGGFFKRVRMGTWLGHVMEHIALELQTLAGMPCGYGRTRATGTHGVYHVVFSYELPDAGLYAAKAALTMVQALKSGLIYNVEKDVKELMRIKTTQGLGPSTMSIVNAATRKKIPFRRLNNASLIMLGQGVNQKLVQASMACTTSSIGVNLACDKDETKRILAESYIPVPAGTTVSNLEKLKVAVNEVGFPIVVKPLNGNHGKGVAADLCTIEQVIHAFHKAQEISAYVIVEKFIKGMDYRFLVINYKLEAIARRTAALVIGDDHSTIGQLIEKENSRPDRGDGHEKVLTKIKVDEQMISILLKKNLTLNSILPYGEILFLKDTANLSTGGTATDVTEFVHPNNIFMAERIARLMNLDICGIDIIAEDITQPITPSNGAVIEVNAAPGLRMHLSPTRGTGRDVGEPIVAMLYPAGAPSRIPIVAVTGTNGKTTTTRLIAHLAKNAGHSVGYSTTDGIYIQEQEIYHGDCSGPSSAAVVLRDPIVDFAVLETARGGILRSGLGFDKCNISIITNITEDHMGLDGINTIEELAKVKSVVARSTFDDGYAILNADSDLVFNIKNELHCNIALFSIAENNRRIREHCEAGGWAAIIEKGYFTICKGEWRTRVAKVNEVPLTMNGIATCMIKNILPSILAASISNFNIKSIRKALQTFIPGTEFTPGRMNKFRVNNFDVMVDYVHNIGGYTELKEFMKGVQATRKVMILGCPGDRRDEDIKLMGSIVAEAFDHIIIRHDKDSRGRSNDELTNLIRQGILAVKPEMDLPVISDEIEALEYALENSLKGSFIVISSSGIQKSIKYLTMRSQTKEPVGSIQN